jgi:hypothetical protein
MFIQERIQNSKLCCNSLCDGVLHRAKHTTLMGEMGKLFWRASMSHMEWKNDRYRKAREGYARLLAVSCATCGTHLFSYQKDGPGIVKRLYLDRIYQSNTYTYCMPRSRFLEYTSYQ